METVTHSIVSFDFQRLLLFYVDGSVRCWSISIIVQWHATQSSLRIILRVHSTCFRVSTTPIIRSTQNCNYSLPYWSYFLCNYLPLTLPRWDLATLEGRSCTKNMTSTAGCSYSFVYCCWWVWLTPKTCRVHSLNNKLTVLCCISLDNYWYSLLSYSCILYVFIVFLFVLQFF